MSTPNETPCQIAQQTRELEHFVKKRVGSAIRDLQCNLIENRGLILRGQATSYFAKQTAQEIVMEMTAIPIISNDIHVSSISSTAVQQDVRKQQRRP